MINFDRVADIYDRTRGLPEGVDEAVADTIVAATNAGPDTRFLEIGVGTGRIAAPLIRRGYHYTGVDISEGMLERLREKAGSAANLTLIQGDITQLPLPGDSQDVVLAVHIFHLVPQWRQALDEALRVLAPGGYVVYGGNHGVSGPPIRSEWSRLVREMGGTIRPRYAEWEDIQEALTERGGRIGVYRAASWGREIQPRALMEAMRQRTFSASWGIEDEVLDAVHERLLAWGRDTFGDLDEPLPSEEEFLVHACRFDS